MALDVDYSAMAAAQAGSEDIQAYRFCRCIMTIGSAGIASKCFQHYSQPSIPGMKSNSKSDL